ncbi:MAG: PadR family transcriptional regulator [Candidatus Micrarchaeota archaeon]
MIEEEYFGRRMGMGRGFGMRGHGMSMMQKQFDRHGFGLRYFILAVLNEGRATGAEIAKKIEEISNYHWRPSPGSLYLFLKEMSDDGYIEVEEEDDKKYYKITKEGKEIIDSAWFPFKNIIKRDVVAELEGVADYIIEKKETLSESDIEKIKKLGEKLASI